MAKIDRVLELIKSRLALSAAIAREQWHSRKPLDDPGEELRLVNAAVNRAASYPLPPEVIQEFMQAQIDAAKQVQASLHSQWQKEPAKAGATGTAQADARQQVAGTTEPLLLALAQAYPILRAQGGRALLERRANAILSDAAGGAAAAAKAIAPLWALAG